MNIPGAWTGIPQWPLALALLSLIGALVLGRVRVRLLTSVALALVIAMTVSAARGNDGLAQQFADAVFYHLILIVVSLMFHRASSTEHQTAAPREPDEPLPHQPATDTAPDHK